MYVFKHKHTYTEEAETRSCDIKNLLTTSIGTNIGIRDRGSVVSPPGVDHFAIIWRTMSKFPPSWRDDVVIGRVGGGITKPAIVSELS